MDKTPEELAVEDARNRRFHLMQERPPDRFEDYHQFWSEVFTFYVDRATEDFQKRYKCAWMKEYTKEWNEREQRAISKLLDTSKLALNVKRAGRLLDEMMQHAGVRQVDLINATGLGRNVPSKYVNGLVAEPSLSAAIKLWGAFGLSPNRAARDFMGWEPPQGEELKEREWEQLEGIIHAFRGQPKLKQDLLNNLLVTAQVFLNRNTES